MLFPFQRYSYQVGVFLAAAGKLKFGWRLLEEKKFHFLQFFLSAGQFQGCFSPGAKNDVPVSFRKVHAFSRPGRYPPTAA